MKLSVRDGVAIIIKVQQCSRTQRRSCNGPLPAQFSRAGQLTPQTGLGSIWLVRRCCWHPGRSRCSRCTFGSSVIVIYILIDRFIAGRAVVIVIVAMTHGPNKQDPIFVDARLGVEGRRTDAMWLSIPTIDRVKWTMGNTTFCLFDSLTIHLKFRCPCQGKAAKRSTMQEVKPTLVKLQLKFSTRRSRKMTKEIDFISYCFARPSTLRRRTT
jgi:hypothetical protein